MREYFVGAYINAQGVRYRIMRAVGKRKWNLYIDDAFVGTYDREKQARADGRAWGRSGLGKIGLVAAIVRSLKSPGWKRLARHRWVAGATITEYVAVPDDPVRSRRRFTATIRGYRNWRLVEGSASPRLTKAAIDKVKGIRDRIDEDDETVFHESNRWDRV